MNIPTWSECDMAADSGKDMTPLELFIFHWEPDINDDQWRLDLKGLLESIKISQ